jgi:cytoskeleton protein RodZ
MSKGASMSEPTAVARQADSAGAMLRAARERQGMHIAALAASIKITLRKLEALENDRFDELPDATFTRALALTVCRALKIDPEPVLARMPQGGATGLGPVTGGLNTPFRERPGRGEPNESTLVRRPLIWAAALVLLAAALVYFLPAGWWHFKLPLPGQDADKATLSAPPVALAAPASTGVAQASAAAASGTIIEVVHSAPAPEANASGPSDSPAGVAVLHVADASWVEVTDASGQVLVQRTMQPGESVGLDGALPIKLKIGNAQGTQLVFRGQVVDLAPVTRDNVARLELK